ncbi:MAG TPA: 2-dehydropantoate 2-reductase [Candidatus Methylacidiphilales bacterium]|nr:2-dehydropantoate 2-reductase [Candidatus Methylacidiphilales bacterium]
MGIGKIAVVGSGAIGLYYGARLAMAGEDVHFLMRSDYEEAARHGIRVRSGGKEDLLEKPHIYRSAKEIGPCDWVIIGLKSTSNAALRELIPPLLQRTTSLLTLQNGLGNEELLASQFGQDRVLGGLCFVCLNRIAPAVVENFGHGSIHIGEYGRLPQPRTHTFAQAATAAGLHMVVVNSLREARWRKQVWNVPFNGLSIAAGSVDVHQIIQDAGTRALAALLMEEVRSVAAALGYRIEAAFQEEMMEKTRVMGPYRPSSLIDYDAGRPVEVEAIWGEAYRIGRNMDVPVPRLEMLYFLLKKLTALRVPAQT